MQTKDNQLAIRLHQFLSRRFDQEDLRTLCFYLDLSYDDLQGEGSKNKARELVLYFKNREQLSRIIEVGRELRPDIPWEDLTQPVAPATPTPTPPALGHHFISYAPADGQTAALQVYQGLCGGQPPLPAWLDLREVQEGGAPWERQVEEALKGCASLLLLVTPGAAQPGGDAEREWRHALRYKKPIVPLLFDPGTPPP